MSAFRHISAYTGSVDIESRKPVTGARGALERKEAVAFGVSECNEILVSFVPLVQLTLSEAETTVAVTRGWGSFSST